jgi:hypothetical protein
MSLNKYKTRFPGARKLQKNTGTRQFSSTSLRFLVLAAGILALLVSGWSMLAAPPASPAINLDQASNGGVGQTPISPVGWENGNQNGQKAHYNEGESIPYRARITGLSPGATYRATFGYDITHSGGHAIDYITSNSRIAEIVNPCRINGALTDDVSPCVGGTAGTIPAPLGDPAPGIQLRDVAKNSFDSVVTIEGVQQVSIFNGNISLVERLVEGDPSVAQSESTFRVTFTATASTSVLSWGGHIARAFDWSNFGGSATTIPGSPFHTRSKALDVQQTNGTFKAINIGNQDRALASSAVQPPSGCTVTGDSSVCSGATNHHELIGPTETGINYSWSITPNTVVISSQNTDPNASTPYGVGKIYADVLASAAYTITLTKSNGAGLSTCPLAVTLKTNTTATDLSPQVKCPGDTASFTTTASGDGPFTFVWKHGSTVLSNGGRISIVTSGATSTLSISNVDASDAVDPSYSVEATGACSTATKSTTLTVNATATLTDPADLTLCSGATATFNTTAAGTPPIGGFVFVWKKGATTISNGGKYTITNGATTSSLQITGIDSNDASSYTVSTTGACNNPSQSANLSLKSALAVDTPPSAASACAGSVGPVNFSVAASGSGPLHYVWKVDGVTVGSDLASLAYDPSALTVGDHTVRVDITDDCTSAFRTTTLTINPNPDAAALADAAAKCQVALGTAFSLDGTASNGSPAWSVVSQDAGITNVSFGDANQADTSVTLTGVGSATLRLTVASESCGSDTADVTVTVNQNPTVSIEATDACATSATLTATVSNGIGPFTYVWTKDGQPFATHSNVAGNTDAISVNATGVYLVTVTDANSCSGARSGQVCFAFTLGSVAMVNPDASITPSYAQEAKPEDASMFYAYLARVVTMFVV